MAGRPMSGGVKLSPGRRYSLLGLWLLAVGFLTVLIQHHLSISADLRLYLPSPQTAQERLLMDGITAGPAARVILLSLSGSDADTLASASRKLAAQIRDIAGVDAVYNGDSGHSLEIPDHLLPYRFLLADASWDAQSIQATFQERAGDLASPLAPLVEQWIDRDPMLLVIELLQKWAPASEPNSINGVWFDKAGKRAIQVITLAPQGFDPEAQHAVLAALFAAQEQAGLPDLVTVSLTGPAVFAATIRDQIETEASAIGLVNSIGLVALLYFAYRRWPMVLLGALPLASAGIAGLATVALIFGELHGITLAFGFTLIGVAQDYPLHYFSHLHPGADPVLVVRRIWPTLATGVFSTCIAYGAFLLSGVEGLAQLGTFTIAGLGTAAMATRWLLPSITPLADRDPALSRLLQTVSRKINQLPRPVASIVLLAGVGVAVIIWSDTPLWQKSLGALTPVPSQLLEQDRLLREDLTIPNPRYLLAIEAADSEQALQRVEAIAPVLEQWRNDGWILDYDLASTYLPSQKTQRARQQALPDPEWLKPVVAEAAFSEGFETAIFAPFLKDIQTARQASLLSPETLENTALGPRLGGLLVRGQDRTTAIVTLTGMQNTEELRSSAREQDIDFIDLASASDALVNRQRDTILGLMIVAAVLLLLVIWLALKSLRRLFRVVMPMTISTIAVVAILQASGIPLNIFHLISLVLAAGLGLDYAMFFERPQDDEDEQIRTLHGALACSFTTILVFAILAVSRVPILQSIGVTVALGSVFNLILALLISRPKLSPPAPRSLSS